MAPGSRELRVESREPEIIWRTFDSIRVCRIHRMNATTTRSIGKLRMTCSQQKSLLPIAMLATALLIWAGLFAMGAYLEWGADRPRHDFRKPLIILGCMAGFLAFWAILLWRRAKRNTRDCEPEAPAYLREMDPRSVAAIEWALWATMMCQCDRCETVMDLPDCSEPPWNEDIQKWASDWAPKVQAGGWSMADDCFNLLCPNCRRSEVTTLERPTDAS